MAQLALAPSLVSICDKSIIKPSSLTPSTLKYHKLSLVDQSLSNMYIPASFFYPKKQSSTDDAINSHELSHITHLRQKSLSQTLISYYPYAGRLIHNATVDCNDMGTLVFPKGLPWSNNVYEDGNLLVAQVSQFDCGGIAISTCLSHKIGDGCSVHCFLADWASATRNLSISSAPRFVGDSVFISPQNNNIGPLIAPIIESNVNECIQKTFVIAESGLQNPTRAEIVSALLFKCATKAASKLTSHCSMRPSKLVHYLNVRTMTKPHLPRNAIGNLLSVFSVEATNEEETELSRLVRNLRKEVEVAYKKDQVEQNELIVEIVESMRKGKLPFETGDDECDMYFCSSVCKFPYYSVDFGWGKPERGGVPNGPFKKMFFLFDYQTGQGVEASVVLQNQQMNAFECDEQLL
ncbi:hypothetical protein R3W88_002357 [Solanum pinnatisectum]|uniref:Acylsugar acyltransferase 3-like n=1 Tax=Solanum pinnatisectum TaxID=50273 RepID=A0AAV9MNK5_9SOLN|nr:hypothetical protein R3W88_002357 [Solanum pinnatisectum]